MTPLSEITIDNFSIPCSKEDGEVILITTDITLREKLLGDNDVEEDSEE